MDVNGTRFHLILGQREWLPAATDAGAPAAIDVEWSGGAVRLRKLLPVFPSHAGDVPPGIDARRGAARDRYGHWYWIGEDRHDIRVSRNGRRPSTTFWSADEAARGCVETPANGVFAVCPPAIVEPLQLAGLAVTCDHYLVAGRTNPNGLLIFDLRGGGAPLMLDWPAGEPFAPEDISAAADGGVWVLDRHARRLWRLDRFFRVCGAGGALPPPAAEMFAPVSPLDALACAAMTPIVSDFAVDLSATVSPDAIEALPDGSVLVLDNPPALAHSLIHRYRLDGTHVAVALDSALDPFSPSDGSGPLPLRGHDIAFVSPASPSRPLKGILYVAGAEGNQTFAFDFTSAEDGFDLALRREYLPMRRFTGKAIVAAAGRVYYDFGERWISLAEHPNPRFVSRGVIPLPAGSVDAAFDGKEDRSVWHRLIVDACIPDESRVIVDAKSSDDPELLDDLPWHEQPDLYRRGDGPELPYYVSPIEKDDRHAGSYELLLQAEDGGRLTGRYLQLRLTLEGAGRTTPRLHALRVYYPRFSYLTEYLPAVYREDPVSASFLERYLANIEGTFTTLEGQIEHVETLFDSRSAPAEYLEWLAAWMGAPLDAAWSERTRRLFLAHAPQMFLERGTCAGLVRAIRLALDQCPTAALFEDAPCAGRPERGFGVRVVERFRTRRAPGVVLGDPTGLIGPGSTSNVSDWTPAQGPLPLHQQYREFLRTRYGDRIDNLNALWGASFQSFADPSLRLAAVRPPGKEASDWQRFVQSEIGFTYAPADDRDEPLYREFLARRYGQPSSVNQAYHLDSASELTAWSDLRAKLWDARLRGALPEESVWLRDWIEFVSSVLPMQQTAHRFTVLVPVGPEDAPEQQRSRRQIAERVAKIEKPAHADFDVKLYWGLFRVGEARVGLDTLLGSGSRSVALVLDRDLVGGSHLGFVEPWNAADRFVVGRDPRDRSNDQAACCPQPANADDCGCDGK